MGQIARFPHVRHSLSGSERDDNQKPAERPSFKTAVANALRRFAAGRDGAAAPLDPGDSLRRAQRGAVCQRHTNDSTGK